MSGKNDNVCGNVYGYLTTERIEELLTYELMSRETPDTEYIDALLSELSKRKAVAAKMSPEKALEEFREEYEGSESLYLDCAPIDPDTKQANASNVSVRPRRLLRPALMAAIIITLVFCSLLVVQACGIDVFGSVARWTNETFRFTSPSAMQAELGSTAEIPEQLTALAEMLKENHISTDVLPTYIPDGFAQIALDSAEMPESTIYMCILGRDDESILLQYEAHSSERYLTSYEKDGEDPIIYESNGIKFYVMTNTEQDLIVWQMDNVECSVYIRNAASQDYREALINSISGGNYG